MADSPDLTPYVDLRLFDRDLVDIQDVAVQDLQTRLPGWVPREDSTEMMLLEGMALEVSESIFALNRLPGSIVQILLQMYGVARDEGAPPTATVTFTVVDTFGYTIPAGTRMALQLPGDLGPVVFTTNIAVNVAFGETTVTAAITGEQYTNRANNVQAGAELEMLDAVNFVETAILASDIVGGRGPESDQAWLTRGAQRFARLTDTLAVPKHFVAAALERNDVTRAHAIDLYDPTAGSGVPGDHPGHLTLAVYGVGADLSSEVKQEIHDEFALRALANLVLHVVDPTITPVDVTVTVKALDGTDAVALQALIEAALAQYLNPETWDWSGTVRRNELIALVSNIAGVDYVATLDVPATDLTLTGVAPLADAGTLTVTVT